MCFKIISTTEQTFHEQVKNFRKDAILYNFAMQNLNYRIFHDI